MRRTPGPPHAPALLALTLALGSGCGGDAAREADRPYTAGWAQVTAVRAEVRGGGAPRVALLVDGSLPDACTRIEPARTERQGIHYTVSIATRRPFGSTCAPRPLPFAIRIPLRPTPQESGTYVAEVNGVRTDFTVLVDPAEADLYRPDLFD